MTAQPDDRARLHDSYNTLNQYPSNLIYRGTYLPLLQAAQASLREAADDLFTTNPQKVLVPFREFDAVGNARRTNVYDDVELQAHLGDTTFVDQLRGTLQGDVLTREDPSCRFIFINSAHNRDQLRLTATMFQRLMTFHQVMPEYIDFVTVFGRQEKPRNLRYGGFYNQTLFSNPARGPRLLVAGRTGRQFSVCFNFKAPFLDQITQIWNIRHAAIYHAFDVVNGKTVWIMTKGDDELKNLVQIVTGEHARLQDCNFSTPENSLRSGLAIYLLLAHWATDGWQRYLEQHEVMVDTKTQVVANVSQKANQGGLFFDADLVQELHSLQDRLNEAAIIMDLNIKILVSIRRYLEDLPTKSDFPMDIALTRDFISEFVPQMNGMIYKLESHAARARLLVQIISDRKALVRDLLLCQRFPVTQHLQTYATRSMENLTKKMHAMGILSQKEAIAMRIITVLTLLYLPATFVSTFYSTDVVKYQSNSPGGSNDTTSFSSLALSRWFAVTVPLTFLTLIGAFWFYKRELRRRSEFLLPLYYKADP